MLLLLAQAYYKMLECAIGTATQATMLDLQLNESYLWVTTNLTNLLQSPGMQGFPMQFEPIVPNLFPSTIGDYDWQEMIAADAEEFLSTVQQYVHTNGICEPNEDSIAQCALDIYRPGVDLAIERAKAYEKRMREYIKACFKSVAAQASRSGTEEDATPDPPPSASDGAISAAASHEEGDQVGNKLGADQTTEPSVWLLGRGEPCHVLGQEKPPLTDAQYDVVKALLEAGEKGLSKDSLTLVRRDARGILLRLKKKDDDWDTVILMPGQSHGGYRLKR